MKHSILHSRRASWAPVIPTLALLTLVLMAGSDARAYVTYSLAGSRQYTFSSTGSTALALTRTGGTTALTVYANLSGSSNFSVDQSNIFWPDSSLDSGSVQNTRYLSVRFSSYLDDTTTAVLILNDSHRSDTITLTGYGPHITDTMDFFLDWSYPVPNLRIDSAGNPTVGTVYIKNHRTSSISVGAALLDSTNWSMTGNEDWTTIAPSGTRTLMITYHPHGVWHDTATVNVVCYSPYYKDTVFHIYATDPSAAPKTYVPTVVAPSNTLGPVKIGDSVSGLVVLENTTIQPIHITAINLASNGDWSLTGAPPTPFWLQSGSKNTMSIWFHPSMFYGNGASANIDVSWADSSGISGTAYATAYGRTPDCIWPSEDSLTLDDVLMGGYVDASTTLIVMRDSILSARTNCSGCTLSILSPTLPKNVHAGDTIPVRFRVTPSAAWRYGGQILFSVGDCSSYFGFDGLADTASSGLQLFPAQSELLAMTTSSQVTVDTFWFVNNYPGEVHIPSGGVRLAQGTSFSILGEIPHSLPDTLTTSQSLGVIVQFSGDTNGFYHDSLYIDASHSLQSMPINLEAIRTGVPAAVRGVAASGPALLWLAPNPVTGPVGITVENVGKASIEVFDLLGNRVASITNTMSSSWDATGMSGGIYIVRATGVDQNGNGFTISKRLILAK